MRRDSLDLRTLLKTAGCRALLGGAALLLVLGGLRADDPPAAQPSKKLTAEEYRKKYPFESVADRLGYEAEAAKALAERAPAPRLTGEAAKRLEDTEKALEQFPKWDMRRKTLELLHSDQAEQFIRRDGFGLSRMPKPSVSYLELPPAPTIPLARPLEFAKLEDVAPPSEGETAARLSRSGKGAVAWEMLMPSQEQLGYFHRNGAMDFLNLSGFGYIKDREHVAGFQPHQFRSMPDLALADPDRARGAGGKGKEEPRERWCVTRLELVSLLKHKEPAVYVSRELPRMEDLKKSKTRPLSEFEGKALKALHDGEDVVTEATANHIRMVGALRASKQCLECHQVRRGDVLGAFS